ncbi:MAG: (2Fe-2S)-binding protein [Alkalispirochaetaceae bacterium]
MRIETHPILDFPTTKREVTIYLDGEAICGREGEPIAAALSAAGVWVHRWSRKRGEPRGVFCAIGRCTDCVMTVDGRANTRTCVTAVREGMVITRGNRGA